MKANIYYAKGVFKTAFKIGCGLAIVNFVGELANSVIRGAVKGTINGIENVSKERKTKEKSEEEA